MANISASLFFNFFIFLFIPFIFALIFKKKNISPIIGYIFGGIVINNFFNGFVSQEIINNFAYFGIILLLFTIGLEINFERLLTIKKFIIFGGLLQVLLSIVFISLLSTFFHFDIIQSFLIGLALSSSSTSLVAKIIEERGEENSFQGELTLGVLMFQDLAFIPFMIIFNSISTRYFTFSEVGKKILIDMLFSLIILWLIYYLGKKIIPLVFEKIARISREVLNLFIIVFIFFVAYISTFFGLPILVSIFIAGILVSQTLEHYHIFSQIRPLRDLLAIIFFIYIGTNIKFNLVLPMLPQILLFTLLVVLIKALIVLAIFLYFKLNTRMSFYLSLYLFQIDEDAFILMSLAFVNQIFDQRGYLFIITSVLLSLILTPILINSKEKIYFGLRDWIKRYLPFVHKFIKYRLDFSPSPIDVFQIKQHVVICGYGRVGAYIGRALMLANIPFVAIDYNIQIVEKAKKEGINIIYGDPTDIDILDYAETENASILVLAVPDRFSQEAIILNARKLNKNIHIISRVHKKNDQKRMKDLGVKMIIQPEFEASLSIIRKIFLLKNISKEEYHKKIRYFRLEQEGI
ncbi:MAG: cation:proton antiporter [Microgenomates group bacterium]|nr:cation:proton antiporter [Microgenomates group bacterium]